MYELLAADSILIVGCVCSASAVFHIRDMTGVRSSLAAHGVIPACMIPWIAYSLVLAESWIGGMALLSSVLPVDNTLLLLAVIMPACLLFAIFAIYLRIVARGMRGKLVSCGCGAAESELTQEIVFRAAVFAAIAGVAAVSICLDWVTPGYITASAAFMSLSLTSSLSIAIIIMWLPVAAQQSRLLERDMA